jgi:hypothetical protein
MAYKNLETGKSNRTNNIPMEFNLGNRSLNRNNATNVFNKYYLNVINKLRKQPPNIEPTKVSLKEAFSQGYPEIINILITESEVKCTIKVLKNKHCSVYNQISYKIIKIVIILIKTLPTFLTCH